VPINEEIGVTYAKVLRTMLRQDPDKILVGEIRDRDTAATAVEASLTGHTVLSTLHTNDAPSAVTRLIDIGVEPFMITATLEAIVAQRLVRRVCANCKESFTPDDDLLRELGPDGDKLRGATFYYGKGCDQCHQTGYRGRQGIYEVLIMNDTLRKIVLAGGSTAELRAAAIAGGMRTLREAGLQSVTEGRTTVEEVLRETMA
jgi:type IV pilus assembly protein PilB